VSVVMFSDILDILTHIHFELTTLTYENNTIMQQRRQSKHTQQALTD